MIDFKNCFNIVEKHIEDRYQMPVMISDVLDPNTGDFDGVTIKIDYDQELDLAFYILLHLFGHSVQWNLSKRYRDCLLYTSPSPRDQRGARMPSSA